MTKYSVDVYRNGKWEIIGLFSSKADFNAMVEFSISQFMNGNSLDCPADDIRIVDLDAGEILWDWESDQSESEDYFPDDVDESNYDPYMGCDFYDYGGEF